MADNKAFNELVVSYQVLRDLLEADIREFIVRNAITFEVLEDGIEALQVLIPALVEKYGDVAVVIAAQYFDSLRANVVGIDGYRARHVKANTRDLGASITWAATAGSITNIADRTLRVVDERVKEASAQTVIAASKDDPSKPRYARVPVGKTCDFCRILGSQGFVYHSEHTAKFGSDGSKFHSHCDCSIVPEWGDGAGLIGYDPQALLDEYNEAREYVESSDPKKAPTTSDQVKAYRKMRKAKEEEQELSKAA